MTKKDKLAQHIMNFVLQQSCDFQFEDITDSINPKTSKKDIIDILNATGLIFTKDAKTFTPRHIHFNNARFIISPTKEEVSQGILIPGHRFIPFLNPNMNPWKCTLRINDETTIPCKVMPQRYQSLVIYYSLFGAGNMENLLVRDQPSNIDVLVHSDPDKATFVNMTVFDFSSVYQEWNFSFKDSIVCEVVDWINGVYNIEYISYIERRNLMDATSMRWITLLEKGFEHVFKRFGITMRIEDQSAYAYFYADKEILENPPIHLGGFLNISNKVFIIPYGIETKLWGEKEYDLSNIFTGAVYSPKKGFEGFMVSLGASCSALEFSAFIQDELYRQKGIVSEDKELSYFCTIYKRIFGDDFHSFSRENYEKLLKYFQKMWRKNVKSYNFFKDQVSGKVRSALLEILEGYYDWFRDLSEIDAAPDEIPIQVLTSMGQMYHTLIDYLELLSNYDESDKPVINQLMELLPTIDESLESLKENVLEQLRERRRPMGRPNLRLVRPSDYEDD